MERGSERGTLDEEDGNLDEEDGNLDEEDGNLDEEDGNLDEEDGNLDEEDGNLDEEDGNLAGNWMKPGRLEDEMTPACDLLRTTSINRELDHSMDMMALSLWEGPLHQDPNQSQGEVASNVVIKGIRDNASRLFSTSGVMLEGQAEVTAKQLERDENPTTVASSMSPSVSLMDTCSPSISSRSSPTTRHTPSFSSSSSSSVLSLTPPLPPSAELSAVLADTRLTLDVYQGGAAALPVLWGSIPGQLKDLQYLRLGSEDKPGLDGALKVLPDLTQLCSLAIRGQCFYDSQGVPLPGLLTTLPSSFSSLSLLAHLDLSFNQLSCLPVCLLSLPVLSSLLLCHNHLSALPPDISQLSSLNYLSLLGNQLVSLPQSLGQLKVLQTLDISHNLLHDLPEEIGALGQLVTLELSHNKLKQLPETMGSLLSLRELGIHSNDLRLIPQCLYKLPKLKMDVRNNLLGRPPTPPSLPPAPERAETKIPELHLGVGQHRGR